ncbi:MULTISPECIES: ROK family protein [Pantoea]|uniref:ROK family protein n=1 Tax=Pantoea brenneri TaxID=472694 RepID=A0ABU9MNZ5_9GAMM|nr:MULTISPECIES: ROK family protein [unclassified Pantoea]KKD30724.1 ROK family protein [Pantoea sp. 3.5.1]MDU4129168.1 ROK family protein [Pantoea sp.]
MKANGKGPALLRLNNQKRVMTQLRKLRITSRQDLAQTLSLSKNTVSLIIDDLLEQELIEELGPVSVAAAGRPKIEITLRPEKLKSAGVMVERNVIHWRVCDYFSQVLAEQTLRTDTENPTRLLAELAMLCRELAERYPDLLGIGLGFPGIVDPRRGWMHLSSHLDWQEVDLLTALRKQVRLPIRIMNNVKAAALLAVQQRGLSVDSGHFYLRISEGIGGAQVQHGEVFTGHSWTAGEAGHLTVQPDGPRCSCGRRGCLEALISQPAVQQQLAQRQPGLSWQNRDSAPRIVDEVMAQAGSYLGAALSQIMLLLNPATIMIDCPWSASPAFCKAVRDTTQASALAFTAAHTQLLFLENRIDPANGLALAVIEQTEQRVG